MSNYKEKRTQKLAERTGIVDVNASGASGASKESLFIKALGSNDFITRDKGLEALTTFLSVKKGVTHEELLKLWKGIFFCFWHSDLEAVQDQLADRLARLQLAMPQPAARLYYEAFFTTMRREWYGIDALRLDKFLRFVRKFLHCSLEVLQRAGWQRALVTEYQRFLAAGLLLKRDDAQPCLGLYFHVCDIFMEELLGLLRAKRETLPGALAEAVLGPFVEVLRAGAEKAYLERVKEGVFEPLVEECLRPSASQPFKGLDLQALHDSLFDLAAAEATAQKGRDALYAVCKDLAIALKKARKEGAVPVAVAAVAEKRQRDAPLEEEEAPSTKKTRKEERAAAAAAAGTPTTKVQVDEPATRTSKKTAQAESGKKSLKQQPEPESGKKSSKQQPEPESGKKKDKQQPEPEIGKKKDKRAGELAAAEDAPARGQGKPSTAQQDRPASAGKAERPKSAANAAPSLAAVEKGYESAPAEDRGQRRVRFANKKLILDPRRPPPPPEVRTPPSARPRGPAIKQSSLSQPSPVVRKGGALGARLQSAAHTPSPLGRLAPGKPSSSMKKPSAMKGGRGTSTTAKGGSATPTLLPAHANGTAKAKGTPKSGGRPKAADFFDLPAQAGY